LYKSFEQPVFLYITRLSDLEKAKQNLWHDNMQLLVVTRGRDGCRFFTSEFQGEADSFRVDAVDATGAGTK
jgi:fructokinase